MTARASVVALLLATALVLAGCDDSSEGAPPPARGPATLSMVRADTLPRPPFAGSPSLVADRDRLIVLFSVALTSTGESTRMAEFDFRSWRWHRLPRTRWRPTPVADGLVALSHVCTVQSTCTGDEGEIGFPLVASLRRGATKWRVHRIGAKPVALDYDPSGLGGSPVGSIGNTAYFGRDGIVSASLHGTMRSVVPFEREPSGLVCIAGRRLMLLDYENANEFTPGPVYTADPARTNGAWTELPGSSGSIAAPGGVFLSACGQEGPVMASRTTLYRFVDGAWLSEPMNSTPTAARNYDPIVTPSGDLVYTDSTNVYRLHRGTWSTIPVAPPPTVTFNPRSIIPFVVVGDVPVAAVFNHATGVTSLRVGR